MAYKDFLNDFKKNIEGEILFLYGAEDYLIDWSAEQIVNRYVSEDMQHLDVVHLDGENCKASDILAAGRSYSMFSERKVVIVRNYLPAFKKVSDPGSEELLEFVKTKQNSAVVVFIIESKFEKDINAYGKKLIKAASSYEFSPLDKAALKGFITKRIQAAGKMISSREMEYLIELSGYFLKESNYHLVDLNRDLFKLTNASEEEQITHSLIEEILVGQEDKYVFNLIDSIMAGDKSRAMSLAETIIVEDDGSMQVLSLLAKQLEIMYDSLELSREGYSMREMAQKTGVNEFRFKKAYAAARNFRKDRLGKLLIDIYNINRDIKTGNIDKDIAFELLVCSM